MKLYAFARDAGGDRLVHVWDAQRMKDAGAQVRFFSTELDAAARSEMVIVHRDGLMFFRYLKSPAGETGGGQTLTHLKVKEFLCRKNHIRLVLPEGMLELWLRDAQSECRMGVGDEEAVICDVCAQLQAGNPPERIRHWPQKIYFEVTVTHPTEPAKIEALTKLGAVVVEIPVDRALWIPEDIHSSEETIHLAQTKLENALARGLEARVLTEPGMKKKDKAGPIQRIRAFVDKIITN